METLQENIERILGYAKGDSVQGRINSMEGWLEELRNIEKKHGFMIPPQIYADIERGTYRNAVKILLDAVDENIEKGYLDLAKSRLKTVIYHLDKL